MDDLTTLLPAPAIALGEAREWDTTRDSGMLRYWDACGLAGDELAALYPGFMNRHGPVGHTRSVFDGGSVVYKVGCLVSQDRELAAFENPATVDGLPVARCRMVHHAGGAPILIMETVRPARATDDIPQWAHRVDSKQVGLDANGDWVIFDAGFGVIDEDAEWAGTDESSCSSDGFIDHPLPLIFQDREAA